MAVASLTARGGIPHGMNRGSRMYWPKAREMTAMPAGLQDATKYVSFYININLYNLR